MLTQLGATAESLSKASTLVSRIGTDAHLYDDPEDVSIAPLLDSKFDSEKCEALKRLLALIAQGFDVSSYFPQVVKNVASQSLEVKKLVYLFLLHYAEKRPNETLLSINCFQKDLGDPNPLVRAWALRTMAGIRLHVIAPLVLVVVGKCAKDPSVYVRKCAAIALPKLHDLQVEEHAAAIEEIIGILLNDNSPAVVGAAAVAFTSVCPDNLTLIGKNYRRLCEILTDVDEWGQIALIKILLQYTIAKSGIVRESVMSFSQSYDSQNEEPGSDTRKPPPDDSKIAIVADIARIISHSYLEGSDKYLSHLGHVSPDIFVVDKSCVTSAKSNDDVSILLRCTLPLLWSSNSAVVLSAAGVHCIMAPLDDIVKIVKPLLFLLRSSSYSKYVVLCNIQVLVKAMPSLFSSHFEDFFISSCDSYQIKSLKLEILSSIATNSSILSIFQEFQDYIRDPDRRFAADVVTAIGLCVQRLPDVANNCLEGLLFLALSESPKLDSASSIAQEMVLVQIIKSIKDIIKQDPPKHDKLIACLVRRLELIQAAEARAVVIWMVGEYCNLGSFLPNMVPVVLKYLARCFTLEAVETRLQILIACIKVLLHYKGESMSELNIVVGYVLDLAICDMSYDVRDCARGIKKAQSEFMRLHHPDVVNDQSEQKDRSNLLAGCIFTGKRKYPSAQLTFRVYLPGSLSQIVFHAAPGYRPLPEPCSLVDDEIRPTVQEATATVVAVNHTRPDEVDNSDGSSGYLDQENDSEYSSQNSATDSRFSRVSSDDDDENGDLIRLSDVGSSSRNQFESLENSNPESTVSGGMMSNRSLELWLNENTSSIQHSTDSFHVPRSLARFSINNIGQLVKPRSYTLLDPRDDYALAVDYVFSSEVSAVSKQLVCLDVSFRNISTERISDIFISEDEPDQDPDSLGTSNPPKESYVGAIGHMEKIDGINPGETTTKLLEVHFEHHLLPLKLMLWYNGNKQAVKLRPNIGYFIKPLHMDSEAFANHESQLTGMFECSRSLSFKDHMEGLDEKNEDSDVFLRICEKLAIKMLGNANLFLVSVDMPVAANINDLAGLCLRFSGEMLSSSLPCLVTITTVKGTCSEPLQVLVRIKCEDTVFALNLLNRVANFLAGPDFGGCD